MKEVEEIKKTLSAFPTAAGYVYGVSRLKKLKRYYQLINLS